MTWPEAVEYACCGSWDEGELQVMREAARAALEGARGLFSHAVQTALYGEESARLGIAVACMGAGLDAYARSLTSGRAGGRDLLVGDGLITRSLEIAADLGEPALSLVAELAEAAAGNEHPSLAMRERLAQRMR